MSKEKLTFEQLPEAMAMLLSEMKELKLHVISNQNSVEDKRVPIGIDEASIILNKAKPTIYTMVRDGRLKAYKQGKRLYFFEDELLEWVKGGKLKTNEELRQEAMKHFNR